MLITGKVYKKGERSTIISFIISKILLVTKIGMIVKNVQD